jgi:hypothetical protein
MEMEEENALFEAYIYTIDRAYMMISIQWTNGDDLSDLPALEVINCEETQVETNPS